MSTWTPAQLADLRQAEEICVAPARDDGRQLRERIIWVVTSPAGQGPHDATSDGRVFVRSTNGPTASWFRAARRSRRGHITTPAGTIDVTFDPVDAADLARVDEAYRAKYGRRYRSIVEHLLGPGPRQATLELHPTIEGREPLTAPDELTD
ncbi:MAG TPA: DUF2255 family protein [Intrasporangium sp.]|uniref:DUF2255 family protein n=1 Tax=Intrasporangium sp. TaxID=1925024 RepID=UPI002D797E2A|nr:DUF2255 family protein [Intrasporangium sp.]HET7397808.1 DUF2255 family protein [Intrasporangium sp.]